MRIVCVHCGGSFTVTARDLGGKGRCPHCQKEITLPKARPADAAAPPHEHHYHPTTWFDGIVSGLGSMVIHMAIVLVVALLQSRGGSGGAGEGQATEVLIGELASEQLTEHQEQPLSTEDLKTPERPEMDSDQELLVEAATPATAAAESGSTASDLAATIGSVSSGDFGATDLGSVNVGGSMSGGSWEGMLGSVRRNGLDIVIVFDSTGSMGGEIDQVKKQIRTIGTALLRLVPKARISVCTYRDQSDEYLVKGLPLTASIQDIEYYLSGIQAGGGGDHEEAVQEGLKWAISKNQFRPNARKVILVFGDAPPHASDQKRCTDLAAEFASYQKGIVSTVTCRNSRPLPEFYEIASAGKGEAFLTTDQRQIMQQLMILVFGSQHKNKVLEAFKFLDE